MIFKLYNCDVGMTIDGVNYDFDHVNNVTIENPEKTRLTRGANAKNKLGLVYKEGLKEASTITTNVIGIGKDLHNVLKAAYAQKKRVDWYAIDRDDGSKKLAKNAVLSQEPQQLSLDDSAESMDTALVLESFDVSEDHKS